MSSLKTFVTGSLDMTTELGLTQEYFAPFVQCLLIFLHFHQISVWSSAYPVFDVKDFIDISVGPLERHRFGKIIFGINFLWKTELPKLLTTLS